MSNDRFVAMGAAIFIALALAFVSSYDRFTNLTLNEMGIFLLRPWFYGGGGMLATGLFLYARRGDR